MFKKAQLIVKICLLCLYLYEIGINLVLPHHNHTGSEKNTS